MNESQGIATITVSRTGNLAGIVTVGYATSALTATPGVDYTDVFGTLTFAAGVTSQSFTVPLLDPFKPALDYGSADFDARHRIAISAVWAVPYAKNTHGFVKQAVELAQRSVTARSTNRRAVPGALPKCRWM